MHFRSLCLFAAASLVLPLAVACSDPASFVDGPARIQLSSDHEIVEVADSAKVDAGVYSRFGVPMYDEPVRWSTSDASIATVSESGYVIAHAKGTVTVTARADRLRATTIVDVIPPRGQLRCDMAGTDHTGLASGRWTKGQSPHFVHPGVFLGGNLTIDAGALVCGLPNASISIPLHWRLSALGSADQPVRIAAVDSTLGWKGIFTGEPMDGAEIVLNHVDARWVTFIYAGELHVDSSSFYLTGMQVAGNFARGGFLTNTTVDSGTVWLSSGVFSNSVIKRGALLIQSAKFGGTVTLDGGRIEDSPGTALQYGSDNDDYDPALIVIKPPQIVGSRGAIAWMRLAGFLKAWPTPAAQAALLDNPSKTITLSTDRSTDSLYLRAGFDWAVRPLFSPSMDIRKLTLEPGANLNMQAFVTVTQLIAPGTPDQPITLRSINPVLLNGSHMGMTVTDSANSRVSNIRLIDAYLQYGQK